jgi:hypothetical protein
VRTRSATDDDADLGEPDQRVPAVFLSSKGAQNGLPMYQPNIFAAQAKQWWRSDAAAITKNEKRQLNSWIEVVTKDSIFRDSFRQQ